MKRRRWPAGAFCAGFPHTVRPVMAKDFSILIRRNGLRLRLARDTHRSAVPNILN